MKNTERANTTALPIDDRPEVHRTGSVSGGTSPISLEQDKELREGERRIRMGDERSKSGQDDVSRSENTVSPQPSPDVESAQPQRRQRG